MNCLYIVSIEHLVKTHTFSDAITSSNTNYSQKEKQFPMPEIYKDKNAYT